MVNVPRQLPPARQQRLAELLVAARVEARLTQVDLSARLGRSQSYVSKIEAGERRIDVVELLDLAEALKCDYHAILSQVDEVAR